MIRVWVILESYFVFKEYILGLIFYKGVSFRWGFRIGVFFWIIWLLGKELLLWDYYFYRVDRGFSVWRFCLMVMFERRYIDILFWEFYKDI